MEVSANTNQISIMYKTTNSRQPGKKQTRKMKNENSEGNAPKTQEATDDNEMDSLQAMASTPERIEADKRSAAYHESSHVFVAESFRHHVAEVQLFPNPNGGLSEQHWLGNAKIAGLTNFEGSPQPEGMPAEEWSQFLSRQSFIQRMICLAGAVGESMLEALERDEQLSLEEVVEQLEDNWECLSESDRRPFPDGPESLDFEEIYALMQLLEWGWDIVTIIAEALMKREHLSHELHELPSASVSIPSEQPWTDFADWRLHRLEASPSLTYTSNCSRLAPVDQGLASEATVTN